MGRLMIHLSDEVERQFRIWIAERGGKKGDLSREIERLLRRELKMKEIQEKKLKGGGRE